MPASVEPVKGRWYYHPQTGRRLQVTWVDKGTELVEACDENGHTEFYPQAEWHALELEPQTDEPLLGEPRSFQRGISAGYWLGGEKPGRLPGRLTARNCSWPAPAPPHPDLAAVDLSPS